MKNECFTILETDTVIPAVHLVQALDWQAAIVAIIQAPVKTKQKVAEALGVRGLDEVQEPGGVGDHVARSVPEKEAVRHAGAVVDKVLELLLFLG